MNNKVNTLPKNLGWFLARAEIGSDHHRQGFRNRPDRASERDISLSRTLTQISEGAEPARVGVPSG
jgi:hypothetical protein